ncbi:MAG: hypothetical protein ABIE55_01870 [Candidatus Aenigmatarchaeota archaeon]
MANLFDVKTSVRTLIPNMPLDTRGIDEDALMLAVGKRSDKDKKTSVYLIRKESTDIVRRNLDHNDIPLVAVEFLGKHFGKQICPFYFLNSVPAKLRRLTGHKDGSFATYEVLEDPFSNPIKGKLDETEQLQRVMPKESLIPEDLEGRYARPSSTETTSKNYMKKPNNTYLKACKLLENGLTYQNAEEVYSNAEKYCDKCKEPHNSNPMTTCVEGCDIWKIKNVALNIRTEPLEFLK